MIFKTFVIIINAMDCSKEATDMMSCYNKLKYNIKNPIFDPAKLLTPLADHSFRLSLCNQEHMQYKKCIQNASIVSTA